MAEFTITKKIVRLTEDHRHEGWKLYPDGDKFFVMGTEGVVIDEHTIGLIPDCCEGAYSDILRQEIAAKKMGAYVVLIDGYITTVSAGCLEIIRYESCNK